MSAILRCHDYPCKWTTLFEYVVGELIWSIYVLQRTVEERLKQLRQTTSDSIPAEADMKMLNRRKFKTTQIIGSQEKR